jgi:cytoskeletal protein CcmA (bactofilin family)
MPGDMKVPPGSTITLGFVDGDLAVGRGATIKGEGVPPKVNVSGTIECRGDCTFECDVLARDFEGERGDVVVQGDFEVKGDVEIRRGRLYVEGMLNAKDVDVDRSLRVGKDLEAEDVDVGGSLEVKGNTKTKTIDVGGRFIGVGEVKAEDIDVGGSVTIESKAEIERIDVGGTVTLCGGRVGEIDVGGSFQSEDALEFDSIDVGGIVRLAGENIGGDIDVGGSCRVDGDLKFGKIDVGGVVEISGSAEGKSLDVGGKMRVEESLRLSGKLDVGGIAEVEGDLAAESIDVGGRVRAREITAEDRVSVGGSIITDAGVKASYVVIGRRGKVIGPIRADEVLISRRANVEEVYSGKINMEENARARNLYGERIYIESGCHIEGEAQYTANLETEKDVSFAKSPVKVEKLPH